MVRSISLRAVFRFLNRAGWPALVLAPALALLTAAPSHGDVIYTGSSVVFSGSNGAGLAAGLVHVDAATGSILKTFSTESSVELVLLGQALPTLGVPVNAHLHANGAAGIGAGRS